MPVYAHSRPEGDTRPWQLLDAHLLEVAQLARRFAPEELAELAETAGLWHDIGKYQPQFQLYIGNDPEASNEDNPTVHSVPHSAAGAALALERFDATDPALASALVCVIAAHHGSLKEPQVARNETLPRGRSLLADARQSDIPAELLPGKSPKYPPDITALGIRMLFSALVDADLLNTEAWDKGEARSQHGDSIEVLRDRLSHACEERIRHARSTCTTAQDTALAAMRERVYRDCVAAASSSPGCFTLTVPTGGGKTLSGMAFALHHAAKHGMRRVIVVAPYTSILEQTADTYRRVFGDNNVVEHHSNLDEKQDTDRNRQACENWDAPIIVTTSVQCFESLYAAHKKSCRKLHSIANSVVLLDEVQTFPEGMLLPIHSVLKQLVEKFRVTVIHGTATQPLLAEQDVLPKAARVSTTEIIREPAGNYDAVRNRFRLRRLGDLAQPMLPEELARHVAAHRQALVIVHKRADAQRLAERLGSGCLHLSAAMCAMHRSAVLMDVRRRLAAGEACVVVATQLVEAGVDIDFPVVFRALAGLATLAQAAGRCNREMKLPQPGEFFVFRPGEEKSGEIKPSMPPPGSLRIAENIARTRYFDNQDPDLNDPGIFPKFSRCVLENLTMDCANVKEAEKEFNFPEVVSRFRMVDDEGIAVVAPYGDVMRLVNELRNRNAGPSRRIFRRLQRFAVTLPVWRVEQLYRIGALEPVLDDRARTGATELRDTLWMVREAVPDVYHPRYGFLAELGELKPVIT